MGPRRYTLPVSTSKASSVPPLRVAVVGGGPAGLRAAEVAASAGAQVCLFDAMGSVGRKFLIAGRSGLNLTNDEPLDGFVGKYSSAGVDPDPWQRLLEEFDNRALREWAAGLGVETFVSNGGKVLPLPDRGRMKSTPLLRRWIERLRGLGVVFHMRHRWLGFPAPGRLGFECGGREVGYSFDRTILALGGASWPRSGSDGGWVLMLESQGVRVTPLAAANCGWEVDWAQDLLAEVEGLPLKNLQVRVGLDRARGELVVTRYGLEGAPIYRLGPQLRALDEASLAIDFKPDQTHGELLTRMGKVRRNFVREARRRLNLDTATGALLKYLPGRGPWRSSAQIVDQIKCCPIDLSGPRPLAEAISTAGGVAWSELNQDLMIKRLPGVYVAGEMIDWEAPTGGYLLQGCFATGTRAGRGALMEQM